MNTAKKVLFVTRDKKPGMIATRIAKVLQAQGAEVRVVAEGLSVAEWKSAGFDNCIVAEGPMDIKAPWEISPKDIFYNVQPDVVVCGLSSPIRSEFWFAAGANNKTCGGGAPLAILDDNWGATHRLSYQANLVLTCDELGKRLVSQNQAYPHHHYQVEIIGDLSATAATEPIPQATIDAFNTAKGDVEYAFILASQKWPESDDIIEIGLASCALSLKAGAKIVIIPRFHPGASAESKACWSGATAAFSDTHHGVVKEISDTTETKHNTDHLAALADGVFAATGSALRAAAFAGKIPLCVWTSRLGEKLKAESGTEHHPLTCAFHKGYYTHPAGTEDMIVRALAIELVKPVDIALKFTQHKAYINHIQEDQFQPVPFDTEKAANAILAIAK